MATSLRKFIQRNKHHLLRFSIFPFAAGVLFGSGLKGYLEQFIYLEEDRGSSRDFNSIQVQNIGAKNKVLEKYGLPTTGSIILKYTNHIIQYDTVKKIPLWVLEHMTKENLKGNAERSQCSFQQDKTIPKHLQGRNEDYIGSGFARGHMVPASDMKDSVNGMKETFLLTNIVPQNHENNGGFWYRMENYCRVLTNRYSNVYVMSGPLFLSHDENEKKFVKYQLIGENEVAVPSHLFKVILIENNNNPIAIGAFVVPNAPISEKHVLKDFQISLQELEQLTGFACFPSATNKKVSDLCVKDGCRMLTKSLADMHILRKNLKRAKSIDDLEKIWRTVREKDIQLDKDFIDRYWKKRNFIEKNS